MICTQLLIVRVRGIGLRPPHTRSDLVQRTRPKPGTGKTIDHFGILTATLPELWLCTKLKQKYI